MSIDNWDATQAGLAVSRLVLVAILVVSAVLALVSAVLFQAPALLGQEKALTDFDVFYIAGTMENHGQANETYNISDTLAAQQSITGTQSLMPWTYPPPYLLLVGVLARMPVGLAYLLFTASSFAFYLLVLRRIAGDHLTGVLIAILPTVLITIRTGQNGFLTGGLVGCFLLAFMRDRTIAGVPLGLMVLKPHLAGGLALLSLLKRRWTVIATATVIVVISLAISTGVFGPGIWVAFLHGAREAGRFLLGGAYPLFRMSSIYAAVRSFGVPASLALAANFAVALGGVCFLWYVWRYGYEPRVVAAVACVASFLVSPYNLDYDLTILGVGIAYVLPLIMEHARRWQLLLLLVLSWMATGYGFVVDTVREASQPGSTAHGLVSHPLSLSAFALLLLIGAGFLVLRRASRQDLPPQYPLLLTSKTT